MPPVLETSPPRRDEPHFLAWAAAALPRAFPGLPALPLPTLRAAWTLAARDISARLALALAREDLVATDHDALRTRTTALTVPLLRRGPFGLHQPDLDVPRPAALEHPHALLATLDLDLRPTTRTRLAHELADSVFNLAMAHAIAELRLRARLTAHPWPAPQDPENLVITGHPWHPMCKTRLGLHLHEILRHAPEALAAPHIHTVDIAAPLTHSTTDFADQLSTLIPPAASGWLRVPVHALQRRRLPHLLPTLWRTTVRPTALPPLPARALLSLRTLAISDLHLKLSTDLQTTSARRQVSPMSSRNGPRLGNLLAHILTTDPHVRSSLRVQLEPAAAGLDPDALGPLATHAGQLGVIVRPDPRHAARELGHDPTVWVCAALGERWPGAALGERWPGEPPVPETLSRETHRHVPETLSQETSRPVPETLSRETALLHRREGAPLLRTITSAYPTPEAALRHYVDLLVPPALRLCTIHGIALELHLQNTLVVHTRGRLHGFIARDLGGVRLHRARLAAAGHDPGLAPGSFIVTDDLAELQTKLAHTLFHAHLAAVFTWAAMLLGADEAALWAHTRATIDAALTAWSRAQPRHAAACATDRAAWLAPVVDAKALLRMRIDERVSEYTYTRVPSPLAG